MNFFELTVAATIISCPVAGAGAATEFGLLPAIGGFAFGFLWGVGICFGPPRILLLLPLGRISRGEIGFFTGTALFLWFGLLPLIGISSTISLVSLGLLHFG